MKNIIAIVFLLTSITTYSQMIYTYDAAGNRVSRLEVKAMETPDRLDSEEEETVDNRTPDAEEVLERDINVYPNPTDGLINMEIPTDKFEKALEKRETIIVTILDHAGKQVLKKTIQENIDRLDVSHLAVGKYILSLTSKSMEQSWQIIKN